MTDLLNPDVAHLSPRRAQTRERLMTAAVTVFADRGIIGASVEEICEAAGFTRGAFYSNFVDKDELVLALLRREIDTQYSAAEQALLAMSQAKGERQAHDLVPVGLTAFEQAGHAGRDWILTQQELLLYAARVPRVRNAYLQFSAECVKQFATLIEEAIGYAEREFTVSFPDAITLLGACHNQVQLDSLINQRPPDFRPLGVLLLAVSRPRTTG